MVALLTAEASAETQRRIAGGLRARGLGPGDRVAFETSPGPAMLSGVLGALRTGIVPVVLNRVLLEHERHALLDDADPALVLDDALLDGLRGGAPGDLAPWPLARPMHYTSGTTGQPKGVYSGILDEADAASLLAEEAEQWGFGPSDRHLVCSPLHHSVAIRFAAGTLLAGGEVVVVDHFSVDAVLEAVRELAPTTTFMAPAHLQRLHAAGMLEVLTGFTQLVHAGAPCPRPLKHAAIEVMGASRVWEFYGSTEGQFSAATASEWLQRPGTVGRARRHRRLFVAEVDPARSDDPHGRAAPLVETGRGVIWCEAPSWARFSYWRDPDKTAKTWRTSPGGAPCFTVGDLGRLDADGYLYLEGRRNDLIITGGVNVYPAEVEAELASAPGVAEVAVFGVDDETWGQRVCAAIVPASSGVDLDVVRAHARARLGAHKRPKELFVVGELPRTSTGKLRREAVAELLGPDDEEAVGSGA